MANQAMYVYYVRLFLVGQQSLYVGQFGPSVAQCCRL